MILIVIDTLVHDIDMITIRRHKAEDDQDLSVLNVLAVFTVWDEEFNDEFEDSINEVLVDNETEDLAKETTV